MENGLCAWGERMRRRELIALISGVATACALPGYAQQPSASRRVGVLMNLAEADPAAQRLIATFRESLNKMGWVEGANLHVDYRWSAGDLERIRKYAAELIALRPDVILAYGGSVVRPLLQLTHSVPIVFTEVIDPIADGFITSLAHPGGNATGFSLIDFGISGKWLELLKQISPHITKVVVFEQPSSPGAAGQVRAIQSAATSFGVEITSAGLSQPGEIERAIVAEHEANGGVIVTVSPLSAINRDLIIALAARYKVPAVYPLRYFAVSGGLISYGPDRLEPYRRAAVYVDRILKGERAAELPVQQPTKYELVINLKTASGLGITIPPTLLALADDVIE
jgi:putative tryptophan/tyrosine transport system substrate-binding protein